MILLTGFVTNIWITPYYRQRKDDTKILTIHFTLYVINVAYFLPSEAVIISIWLRIIVAVGAYFNSNHT